MTTFLIFAFCALILWGGSKALTHLHDNQAIWATGCSVPTIDKENDIVTLVNVFTVDPANQKKVVDMLVEATAKTMQHLPGFVSASIHKSLDGVRVVNYAQWRSRQDFEKMRNNPAAQKHMRPLMEIAEADFHLYEVAETVESKELAA
jgi:quinol monooxygenase YgiN